MHTIVVTSFKGGTGKSTLTAHLAVEAEKQGCGPVAVVDADAPQGSLSQWWNTREAETPLFASVDVATLAEHMESLSAHGIETVIIDTPPAIAPTIQATIHVADLVVIPVRPSPHDLRAIGPLLEAVGEKNFIFVINAATPRTNIATDAVRALAQHGKVAPVTIHNRVNFATSMIDGITVTEADNSSRSAAEVTSLWNYVSTQLRK